MASQGFICLHLVLWHTPHLQTLKAGFGLSLASVFAGGVPPGRRTVRTCLLRVRSRAVLCSAPAVAALQFVLQLQSEFCFNFTLQNKT